MHCYTRCFPGNFRGSDLSACLRSAHCTVYSRSGVMGAWDSAGWTACNKLFVGKKIPFVFLHKETFGLSIDLVIKVLSFKKHISLPTQHP